MKIAPSLHARAASATVVIALLGGVLSPVAAHAAPVSATGPAGASSVHTVSGGEPVPLDTVYGGMSRANLTSSSPGLRTNATDVPYAGQLTIEPTTITNYDLFAAGVNLTATGLGANQRALITDTSPSGDVFTFDPVTTDETGSVTTTVRRADRIDPEVGVHRFEVTTADGAQAGALLEVTLSERLNATATASPGELTADQFHDTPVTFAASGFAPGEWVTAHFTTPDGDMGLLAGHLQADADGALAYALQAASAAITPGPWTVTFVGMSTTRSGIATFEVTPSPDNREVGTLRIVADSPTTETFVEGLGFVAESLPPFGLFDVELRSPNNRDTAVGRFRADGDGRIADALVGENLPAGEYRLSLVNVDTADYVRRSVTISNPDGSVPVAPTITLAPSAIDATRLITEGVTVTATGYEPGERVALTVRDSDRRLLQPSFETVAAKQTDEDGAVQFQFRAKTEAAAGTWEVAIATPLTSGLITRANLTVTAPGTEPSTPPTEEGSTPPVGPDPAEPDPAPQPGGTSGQPDGALPPSIDGLTGTESRSWFVRTTGEGALAYSDGPVRSRASGSRVDPEASARVQDIESTLEEVVDEAVSADEDATTLYETVWTVPGVAIHASPAAAERLAERSDVVSVTPIVTKQLVEPVTELGVDAATPMNGPSDELTGALDTWTDTGYTGADTTIAVIDTGVDYTHADFGGPGGDGYAWYQAGTEYAAAMPPASSGLYDPSVILPGYDFAGARYNADPTSPAYFPIAEPDTNAIDGPGGGHGTHVAGTAAGRGVTADGATYDGDYTALTAADLEQMGIAPGSAPEAQIVPLKVFGDNGGSTDLAGAALDWIGGQIARGVDIDVANLSLGASFTAVDDPENDLVQALVDAGVVVVISAGNSGDVTDVGGSPGNAEASLSVAASRSGFSRYDAVEVFAPSSAQGVYEAQFSQEWPLGTVDNSGPVAAPTSSDPTGCTPFSAADAARLGGHVVWLEWDEAALAAGTQCGSAVRFQNVANVGGVGVLLTSTLSQFDGGIAGFSTTAGAQLTAESTAALRPLMEAGTLGVRIASENAQRIDQEVPELADTLADFSSRGVHGTIDDVVKPDISAPGVSVVSARWGSGTGSKPESGTSMAAPHTAGIAALTKQAHPTWSAQRIKTVLMNTATTPVTVAPGAAVASPLRSGTGRVEARQAVESQVTVAAEENGGLVTASFGVVEIAADGFTEQRTLELENTGTTAASFEVALAARTQTPGATFSLDRTAVSVPAGGTAQVTVTLAIPDRAALRRSVDPDQDQDTASHLTDVSSTVQFTPTGTGGTPLAVTVFAAPKPVSTITAADVAAFDSPADGDAVLELAGLGIAQGEADAAYRSRVTPLIAGPSSPRAETSETAAQSLTGADILTTGASSTAERTASPSQGLLSIGVGMAGPVVGVGTTTFPTALLDLNRDGRDDIVLRPRVTANGSTAVVAIDLGTGLTRDEQPLNGLDTHVNQFDNDTLVLPVQLDTLGYTDTTAVTALAYRVSSVSYYAPVSLDGSSVADQTGRAVFDVYAPPVRFETGDAAFTTAPSITLQRGSEGAGDLLVIAHDNATGSRTLTSTWATGGETVVTGIEVTTMPTRTTFTVGEAFDAAGLVVSAVSSDGSRRVLDDSEYTLSAVDTGSPGERTVEVGATIGGEAYRTAFTVTYQAAGAEQPGDPGTDPGTGGGAGGAPGDDGASDAGPGSDLAETGATIPWAVWAVAITLLLAGGILLLIRARRRSAARQDL